MIMSGYDFLKSQLLSCRRKVDSLMRRRYLLRQSVPDTGSSKATVNAPVYLLTYFASARWQNVVLIIADLNGRFLAH